MLDTCPRIVFYCGKKIIWRIAVHFHSLEPYRKVVLVEPNWELPLLNLFLNFRLVITGFHYDLVPPFKSLFL